MKTIQLGVASSPSYTSIDTAIEAAYNNHFGRPQAAILQPGDVMYIPQLLREFPMLKFGLDPRLSEWEWRLECAEGVVESVSPSVNK